MAIKVPVFLAQIGVNFIMTKGLFIAYKHTHAHTHTRTHTHTRKQGTLMCVQSGKKGREVILLVHFKWTTSLQVI